MKKLLVFLIFVLIGFYAAAQIIPPLKLNNKKVYQIWGVDTNKMTLYVDSTYFEGNDPLYLDYPGYYMTNFASGSGDSLVLFANSSTGEIDTIPFSSFGSGSGFDSTACWQILYIDSITACSPVTIFDGSTYYHFTDSMFHMKTSLIDTLFSIGGYNSNFLFGDRNTVTGSFAGAISYNSTASGDYSFIAGGSGNTANVTHAYARGESTTASGTHASSSGSATTASGDYSTASGLNSTASGNISIAGGNYTTASGVASLSFGNQTLADGDYSFAIGDSSIAVGKGSFAGGRGKANALYSFAWGDSVRVEGTNSIGMGYNNKLLGAEKNISLGSNNTLNDSVQVAFGCSNTLTTRRTFAIGQANTLTGGLAGASAMGVSQTVSINGAGYTGIGIGYVNTSTGCIVLGHGNTGTSTGNPSVVLGQNIVSTGGAAACIGLNITAGGTSDFIIGNTITSTAGTASIIGRLHYASNLYGGIVGGAYDTISGWTSFVAAGYNSSARDTCSVTFGQLNKSSGKYSLTQGYSNAITSGADFSGAFGYNNTVAKDYTWFFGNAISSPNTGIVSHNLTANDTVFIGDSSWIYERSDTLDIYSVKPIKIGSSTLIIERNGDVTVSGDLTVTGTINATPIYAQRGFADSSNIISMTQNNYYVVPFYITQISSGITFTGDSTTTIPAGDYAIDWDLSYSGSNTDLYHISIFVNGVEQAGHGEGERDMTGTSIGSSSGHAIMTLSANDNVTVRIKNTANNNDVTIYAGNVRFCKVN